MIALGNICIVLALLLFLLPFQWVLHTPMARGGDGIGGNVWTVTFVLLPMWLLFTVCLCIAASRGGLDWITRERVSQYLLAVTLGLALIAVTWFSAALRGEPGEQIPWAVRVLVPWAAYVIPPVVLLFSLSALNPSLRLPLWVARWPFAVVATLSLLAGGGLVLELLSSTQQRASAQVQETVNRETERDATIMAQVEAADPVQDFGSLLSQTSKFENPQIRAVALKKVLSNPDFAAALSASMKHYYYYAPALTFLDGNDTPDPKGLAEAVKVGIESATAHARSLIQSEPHMYADQFDYETAQILSIAAKYASYGVEYVPAIREYRAAMDDPRQQKVKFNARRTLDQWLARAR